MAETVVARPGGLGEWRKAVLEANRRRCSNCGSEDRLAVSMIVPLEAGGQLLVSNGVVLCRTCEVAADAVRGKRDESARRPINIWISRRIYDGIQRDLEKGNGFSSMGSLIRYLIDKYIENPDRFDDLSLYQDTGSDVKINVWAKETPYLLFKRLAEEKGSTVTDTLKSLLVYYQAEPGRELNQKTEASNV